MHIDTQNSHICLSKLLSLSLSGHLVGNDAISIITVALLGEFGTSIKFFNENYVSINMTHQESSIYI